MITLSSQQLQITIANKGAELQSIYSKQYQIEYLWNGNPAYWNKRAPVLFPIVGQLKNNTYKYNGHTYHMNRHGFARDKEFVIEHKTNNSTTFLLVSDEETRLLYPFDFEFRVHYNLQETQLSVSYDVHNIGNDEMYFSVGGHPAFSVPFINGTKYEDYYLEFEDIEHAPRWLIKDNLITHPEQFLDYEKRIHLTHPLFYKDALVFEHLKSDYVTLKSNVHVHSVRMYIASFPYLGIWAHKDAPFVCIEPWQGLADHANHNQQLTDKEGIVMLEAAHRWQQSWQAIFM